MATVNLNPNSTVSNNWNVQISGGVGTASSVLADSLDNTSIRTALQFRESIVELQNFSTAVPSYTSITSIRFLVRGVLFNTRSGNTDIQVKLENSSGTDLYSETVTLNFTNFYAPEDHYGTVRTTSNGSDAWTATDLDGLRLSINTNPEDPPGLSQAQVSKAYVEVTYGTGYSNDVSGVTSTNISEINGISASDIAEVNGV